MFTVKQVRALKAKLKDRHVRSRIENGTTLHYLEGWHVIAEANRIFGFDGWDRETVDTSCVYTKRNGERYEAVYVARVRIRVLADGHVVIREGSGSGEADTPSPGQAHEFALKAAETDATKRALMTFGNAFGLSLYDPNGPHRSAAHHQKPSDADPPLEKPRDKRPSNDTAQPRELAPKGPVNGHAVHLGLNGEPAAEEMAADESESAENGTARKEGIEQPDGAEQGEAHALETVNAADPTPDDHRVQERQDRIDKSTLALSEPIRCRDPEHLKFVVRHGCVICGRDRTHAHHLTFAQPNALGRMVSDEYTVPLCSTHHRDLHHAGNESEWWAEKGVDPMEIAKALWEESGKTRRGRSQDNKKGRSGADV